MLKKNIGQNTQICLTKRAYEYLAFNDDVSVIVFPLTSEIKNKIEKHDEFTLKLPNYRTNKYSIFKVRYSNIGFFGELDLSKNSEELKAIASFPWYDKFKNFGHWLYSTFDYKTCSITKTKPQLQYECYSIPKILEFIHAVLDYPKEICIAEVVNRETYELNSI